MELNEYIIHRENNCRFAKGAIDRYGELVSLFDKECHEGEYLESELQNNNMLLKKVEKDVQDMRQTIAACRVERDELKNLVTEVAESEKRFIGLQKTVSDALNLLEMDVFKKELKKIDKMISHCNKISGLIG